jgi:hypothetical protein
MVGTLAWACLSGWLSTCFGTSIEYLQNSLKAFYFEAGQLFRGFDFTKPLDLRITHISAPLINAVA